MMPTDRFERHLPRLLDDLAEPQTPEYFDELLWQTAHTSQRSAWTTLERWLPMLDAIPRPVAASMPWRPLVVLVLIVAALLASLALAVASRQALPPLYGPAGNGLVVHSEGGDIYTYDPRTGQSRAIVAGPYEDFDPVFSQDGTRILFQRRASATTTDVYIARTDGSGLRGVTTQPLEDVWSYDLSPDGKTVAIVGAVKDIHALFVANADGSGMKNLDVGIVISSAIFRPTGSDILFVGAAGIDGAYSGLYLIDPDGTNRRTLIEPNPYEYFSGDARWSPDGTRIAYSRWLSSVSPHDLRVHVVDADGTNDTIVGHDSGAWLEDGPIWSPDGTRLLIERNSGPGDDYTHPRQPIVVSAENSSPDVVIGFQTADGVSYEWSPDGTAIVARPIDSNGNPGAQVLWDPTNGRSRPAPWNATSYPAWQRVAR